MVPIYIAFVVVSPSFAPEVFRRVSNLPFPNPIGTRMMVADCDDVEVKLHYHDNPWKEDYPEAFYVFVAPLRIEASARVGGLKDLSTLKDVHGDYDYSKSLNFEDKHFNVICKEFEKWGWEKVSEAESDYLSFFFLEF